MEYAPSKSPMRSRRMERLAVAGACLQGLFRNPLADPGLIGVSSGGALGAIFVIVFGSSLGMAAWFMPYALP
ncbi:MAG: hypothetical protein CMB00_04605, partial [Euryarchaeota archaeon]|nr:hypothetical protein [Euryarchaeota archaeon]